MWQNLRELARSAVGRVAGRAIALLAVYGTVAVLGIQLHAAYRDSNVRMISVAELSDLEEEFEISVFGLRIKNSKFLKVCFTGDYVHPLKDAQQWFLAGDTEFKTALRAAGGPADVFNDDDHSSIVLLTHRSALIVRLSWEAGFSVGNVGCADVHGGAIEVKTYETNDSVELRLKGATPKAPRGSGQPRVTLCAQKLERLVESIDELLAQRVRERVIWAAIRKYAPETGCRADEVLPILRTSKFFVSLLEQPTQYGIALKNPDWIIQFVLDKDTGNIAYAYVRSRHPAFS